MSTTTANEPKPSLSAMRFGTFIALGVFLWFMAAIWLREFAPAFYDLGILHLLTLATGMVAGPFFVWFMAVVSRTPISEMLAPSAIALFAATVCDSLAITYFPAFYSEDPQDLAYTGAQLLWGVAFVLLSAVYFHSRGKAS